MKTTSQRGQRGTQIVELAIVMPLLIFMALVVSEGAAFVRVHQVLNNAARESARLSVLPENHGSAAIPYLQDTATCYMVRNGVIPPAGQVPSGCPVAATTPTCNTYSVAINQSLIVPTPSGINMTASKVQVTCGYGLKYLPRLPWFGVQNVVTLGGSVVFRNFYGLDPSGGG
jgi:Flp pilus assembly protein TadG